MQLIKILMRLESGWTRQHRITEPNVRKRTFGHVRPAKIQISLRIRAVWSESSLSAFWIAKDAKFVHADSLMMIWVFVGRTLEGTFFHVTAQFVFAVWYANFSF